MASFSLLPKELLSHIFDLSTEGDWIGHRQSSRFDFSLISRASYLATADATDFSISGDKQIKAFLAKLERETRSAAQEERKKRNGRTTRASTFGFSRVSNVRRLYVQSYPKDSPKALVALLRASPNLVGLYLDLGTMILQGHAGLPNAAQLEQSNAEKLELLTVTLVELEHLREFRLNVMRLYHDSLLKLLLPLTGLEVLGVQYVRYESSTSFTPDLLDQLAMPHLRKLEAGPLRPSDEHDLIFNALASRSTAGLQSLNIGFTSYMDFSTYLPSLLPFTSTLVNFTWVPDREPLRTIDRDAVLFLLGSMSSVQSLTLSLWTLGDPEEFMQKLYYQLNFTFGTDEPIDTTVFDTLVTLPDLHTVDLKAYLGVLDDKAVKEYITKAPALRTLIVTAPKAPESNVWRLGQRRRVVDAGEKAGVLFSYKINKQDMF
ncbi:hypothetical protein RQP46_008060 [Phenoliferia psychrophenolica]